jgi:release factor glutamine methyltransferase
MRVRVDGLVLEVPDSIYEPSDDSFLLMKHSKNLKGKVLDMGCGCGIQALINAKNNPNNFVLGVDINPTAIETSRYNASINGIKNAFFSESNLFDNISHSKFHGIIFNPPYLPTQDDEKIKSSLNYAFDGGKDGRFVIDSFLYDFEKHLEDDGILLLLQSEVNNVEKTIAVLEGKDFMVSIRDRVSFFFEKIYLLEARRQV